MGMAFLHNLVQRPWQHVSALLLVSCIAVACVPIKADSQPASESPSRTPESTSTESPVNATETASPTRTIIPTRNPEYDAGYAQGIEEAKKEIAEGYATVYYLGAPMSFSYHPGFGVPYKGLGCTVVPETQGRTDGHNDFIASYIFNGGVPKNSTLNWKKWVVYPEEYLNQPDVSKIQVDSIASLQSGIELDTYRLAAEQRGQTWELQITRQDTKNHFDLWRVATDFDNAVFAAGPHSSNLLYMMATYPYKDNYSGGTRIMVWETIRGVLLNNRVPGSSQGYPPGPGPWHNYEPARNRKDREPVD